MTAKERAKQALSNWFNDEGLCECSITWKRALKIAKRDKWGDDDPIWDKLAEMWGELKELDRVLDKIAREATE